MKNPILLKKTLTITALLLILNTTYGQIGINTNEPDESAVLEIFSDTKGILIPRLETSVRQAYEDDDPANGVIVYDVQLSKFFVWRRTESGIETKGGHWLYINPWDVDDTYHTMSLSSTVASSVTIGGDLRINGSLILDTENTAFNKNFGTGNDEVARGDHKHSNYSATVNFTDKSGNDGRMEIVNGVIQNVWYFVATEGTFVPLADPQGSPYDAVSVEYVIGTFGSQNWTIVKDNNYGEPESIDVFPFSGEEGTTPITFTSTIQGGLGKAKFILKSGSNTLHTIVVDFYTDTIILE